MNESDLLNRNIACRIAARNSCSPCKPSQSLGTTGQTGATGATGAQGIPGDNTGSTGDMGATGATGAIGPTGPPSDKYKTSSMSPFNPVTSVIGSLSVDRNLSWSPGQRAIISYDWNSYILAAVSAYDNSTGILDFNVIFYAGITGTRALWTVNLSGFEGTPGLTGYTGSTGPEGRVSATGATGATGPGGETGPKGGTGATGMIGPTGAIGATGFTGIMGYTGPVGATGPIGITGDTGRRGIQGETGATGIAGDKFKTISSSTFDPTQYLSGTIVVEPGLSWTTGQQAVVVYDTGRYMLVSVTSYEFDTGVFSFDVLQYRGISGPLSIWVVNLSGFQGYDGVTGATGPAGTSSLTGSTGAPGTTIFGGTGPPGNFGRIGDFFINYANGYLYRRSA